MSHLTFYQPTHQSLRQALNRMFDEPLMGLPYVTRSRNAEQDAKVYGLPLDLHETSEAYHVSATLPGCDKDAIDIGFHDDVLTIKARVTEPETAEDTQWLMRERFHGQVQRSVKLPTSIDPDKAEASYRDGVLRLTLPKTEAQRPRTIKVNPN